MNSTAAALTQRLAATPTVGIIGLGYVGLPLAVAFAESGAAVIGLDVDPRRVASVRAGQSFVEDVSTEALGRLVRAERLVATDDVAALKDADAIVICVPTPLGKSKEPDISYIVSAADAVAGVLRRGQLIVLESTTYPGTTQEILQPRFEARGLKAGEDFFLAFSPERIDPGNQRYTLKDIPKVVGGLTPACRELATTLYARITRQVVPVSGPQTAEMVKLFENTFRSVNIALVNEFAIMCRRLGISVWEVIGAAATKPFGFMPFYPGPGLGGHCLPSDPHYLSWRLRLEGYEPRFIAFADEINRRMPTYVVQLVADALNDRGRAVRGARILVLGVAYKANVADTRDSPAIEIIQSL
ncbi:MAG: UDP-N-acetyl-D-glucosamine dehydrogenase, partial [Candidatus Rokubacteria bacterium 13_2_20CM_69_15_1]